MQVTVSKFAGFCDGVRRAYEIASRLDMARAKKPVMILGSLVHNEEVNRRITEKGIVRIDREPFFNSKKGEIGTLIITAHGDGPDVFAVAEKKGIEIIDATCPKVVKVQRLAKVYFERGYKLVIIGDKNHKEVRGIGEWGGSGAYIISDEADLAKIDFSKKDKIAVVSQTTQSEDFFLKAGQFIVKKYPQAEVISTVCLTTHQRQDEITKLAGENDLVIVIGSKESANSNRLFEIARSINPKSYFVGKAEEIKKNWFSKTDRIAVTAGASTPAWIIDDVLKRIEESIDI